MQAGIDKLLQRVEYVTDTLAIVSMFACMIVIAIEVFCRYALNSPQSWVTDVLVLYLLPGLFFMGLPGSYARGSHVAVDILIHYVTPNVRLGLSVLARIIAIIVFFAICYYGTGRVIEAVRLNEVQPGMLANWPIWPSVLVVPIGCAISLCRAAERLMFESYALMSGDAENIAHIATDESGREIVQ
jgi:TRAP-type C4-dicarboxylate transport system permease small subunit